MGTQKKDKKTKQAVADEIKSEFESLDLPGSVLQGILDVGFTEMTPIQRKSLPIGLAGKDVRGQAQTGTGKTAAFLIPIFTKLINYPPENSKRPSTLILAPTRELALQIFREAKKLAVHAPIRILAVYGGEGYGHQENKLRAGVDIVVGTPGRVLDFARRRVLVLSGIQNLVIDEADRLLDMGFWEELRNILRMLPSAQKRQSFLFSATLDHRTRKIASGYMNNPKDVVIKPEQIAAEGIDQVVFHVEKEMKFALLLGLLSKEEIPKGLIFANMKITAAWLVKKLQQHGFDAALLTGDLNQRVRNRVLEKFMSGQTPLLIASDVASRGLHIDDVTHIINFDVPVDPEDYVHRIGRTARAGKKGKAYTLACDDYCRHLPDIEKILAEPIPSQVPYDEDYGQDDTPEFTRREMQKLEWERKRRNKARPNKPSNKRGRHDKSRKSPHSQKGRPSNRPQSQKRQGPKKPKKTEPPI